MKSVLNEALVDQEVQKIMKKKDIYGTVLCVESGDSSISVIRAAGNMTTEDRYYIASVTKLYVTTLMLILRQEEKLSFSDKMYQYFPEELISGVHKMGGTDYTKEITIGQLLSNTSGIADYFYYSKAKGKSPIDMIEEFDEAWPLERALQNVKTMKAKFKPGQKGKVYYSDTNFRLLGGIIENVTGMEIGKAFDEYICKPLKCKDTYAYQDRNDRNPIPFYYKDRQIHAPNYMVSVTADGGIVSTARETMDFVKAFFNGFFFPKRVIQELKENWNMIYFPGQFYFGLGLEKLWTPRFLSPFKPIEEVLGFWGQTGAFAFYNPETDLYFTGTINQVSGYGHSAAYKAIINMIKLA